MCKHICGMNHVFQPLQCVIKNSSRGEGGGIDILKKTRIIFLVARMMVACINKIKLL